jgi:rhodanese-related sulfurtransferase
LKRAGLVTSTRQGTSIRYQIADLAVARFWIELRALATQQLPEFERALDGYRPRRKQFATIDLTHTIAGLRDGSIVLLDVRPRIEYLAGHLPFARSIPLDELTERIEELPSETLIVTYCRGPLCVYADQALEQILASGRQGARLEEGFAEWQLAESPLSRS